VRSLNDSEMLAIARDVGYSETAFVLPIDSTAAIRVRYFSPLAEVAFCRHATVATAVALADRDGPGGLELITLAGFRLPELASAGLAGQSLALVPRLAFIPAP
jgi:PhzF family phenazine biosynthesis protein